MKKIFLYTILLQAIFAVNNNVLAQPSSIGADKIKKDNITIKANGSNQLYVDPATFPTGAAWGGITGTLSDQIDLQTELDLKVPFSRFINTTSPLNGGGDLSTDLTLGVNLALADGIPGTGTGTIGVASFNDKDFDDDGQGIIAINYFTSGIATSTSFTNFTNKTGLISQWTNDVGYITSAIETDPIWIADKPNYATQADVITQTSCCYTPLGTAVPLARNITINGTTQNLNADRTWTVGDLTSVATYNNPSWLNTLAWSKITGTPTTIAGYGITDFNTLGDARYFQISNNLSEGTAATMRTNLGLGNVATTNFGTATTNTPEIGSTLGNSKLVYTDVSGKLITSSYPSYTLQGNGTELSLVANTVYNFGTTGVVIQLAAAARRTPVVVTRAGTLKAVYITAYVRSNLGTAGQTVAYNYTVNNAGSTSIGSSDLNAAGRITVISNTGLSTTVNVGDLLEVVFTTPAVWTQPATNVTMNVTFQIEYSN